MRTVESIKENELVRDLEKFIEQHVTASDIPELFVKENFKDETTIKGIQDSIQAGCGAHVYVSEIVEHLIKHAKKIIKNKTKKDSEDCLVEDDLSNEPGVLLEVDYYDHGCDPSYYEGKFDVIDEVNLEN
ncbi:MAG: hypothetical protein WAW11_00040 [Patescibacteria group bacterium]